LPRTIWALGFVSLFMDVSSEIIHALLPVFLTTSLGASVALVGLIDGVAEATASISKVFSGYISDRIGKRKPLILLGYGLAAFSKPLFALAASPAVVLGARFADRIGKGLRGAPRDALIADLTSEKIRGRAYGLRQALDTSGAFIGPLAAIGLMALFANDFRAVFAVAIVPALIAVFLVLFGVEDRGARAEGGPAQQLRLVDAKELGAPFARVLLIGAVFTLARFSEAFLILKAADEGLPIALAPLTLVVMNVAYAAGAYPAGALADSLRPKSLLLCGIGILIVADIVLALSAGLAGVFLGIALWGAHLALTQGLLSKLVADTAPTALRGTAFGVFNLATGAALLIASVSAGLLWDAFGSAMTFFAGGAIALVAALLLLLWNDRPSTPR
jgi:MFS family permease